MKSSDARPRSLASQTSWLGFTLAIGSTCIFLAFLMIEQVLPFDQTRQGVLTGFLPRTVLVVVWLGQAVAAIIGFTSFFIVRRMDAKSKAIIGIAVRGLTGVVLGLSGSFVLWLYVGHRVIGF